jgi:hypothetical protein
MSAGCAMVIGEVLEISEMKGLQEFNENIPYFLPILPN